jgi:hypothetical protein
MPAIGELDRLYLAAFDPFNKRAANIPTSLCSGSLARFLVANARLEKVKVVVMTATLQKRLCGMPAGVNHRCFKN